MNLDAIRAVANAVLYEGYMLYPYRPSALKNRSQGWTFGTLLPQAYAAAHPGEPHSFSAEVLLVGEAARISAEIRFLQLCGADAIERTLPIASIPVSGLNHHPAVVPFALPAAEGDATGCRRLQGTVEIAAESLGCASEKPATDLHKPSRIRREKPKDPSESVKSVASLAVTKVSVSLHNQSPPDLAWDTRDHALQQALVSAHALLFAENGEFVSLLSPPDDLRAAAASCNQSGVFPVLAGDEAERTAMLLSPIILYDYPQIAASSQGDFFDSSEIDEMLTLRVLTLTDQEKAEVRAAGGRARDLLQRTEALSPREMLDLHGIVRQSGEE